jgi:hypothetical protein
MGRSAYGHIKETDVMNCLPVDELDELEILMARRRRSAASEHRLAELWDKAFELHEERMQARKAEGDAIEDEVTFLEEQLGI